MLQYLLERLHQCNCLDRLVVATSSAKEDNAIESYCTQEHINVIRGPLNDVAGRFLDVLDSYAFDAFVRVNGDSPLLDQRLVEKAVTLYSDGDFDLVTNVHPRTYPKGQSVEVIRTSTFRDTYSRMRGTDDLEHVTAHFYKNPQDFRILNFESGEDLGAIQLSVDTKEDMDVFSQILSRMTRPHWEYTLEELLLLYREVRIGRDTCN